MYLPKVPPIIRQFYTDFLWSISTEEKELYLTFDDGPTPEVSQWVIDQLAAYKAKATFFVIGDKVTRNPHLLHHIIDQGHSIGNHSYTHPDGWRTSTFQYLRNFRKAQDAIEGYSGYRTHLFRPPYGRIRQRQARYIQRSHQIVMLDVLAGDFDTRLSPESCLDNVLKHAEPGSIVCLHDSEKAWPRLRYVLPRVLEHFAKEGYQFKRLNPNPLR